MYGGQSKGVFVLFVGGTDSLLVFEEKSRGKMQ